MAKIQEQNGMYELSETDGLDSSLTNADILPTPIKERTWSRWHIASLWVGMAVCIPTYMLAAQMITGGLSWKEALVLIVLGNVIVSVPMVFNGHAGTKFGIPFPVLGRASFGWLGIQIPSLLRALVACGWFGIQTWLGGLAIVSIFSVILSNPGLMESTPMQFIGFGIFWCINMFFVWRGTESIRVLESLAAPLLIIIGVGMLGWGITQAGGLDNVLSSSYEFKKPTVEFIQVKDQKNAMVHLNLIKNKEGAVRAQKYRSLFIAESAASEGEQKALEAIPFGALPESGELAFSAAQVGGKGHVVFQFASGACKDGDKTCDVMSSPVAAAATPTRHQEQDTPISTYLFWLTAMVAFWATLALNIPDITRFAKSQKAQVIGQFVGLPTTMALYSFIGVAVTCAAIIIFDDILITADAPWDPIRLIARFSDQPVMMIFAQLSILLATLSTNIAANVISPANSFANLLPKHISFRTGGLITGVIGILLMPWWLLGLIVGFLITYGAILGPVVGILLADYFVINKKELALDELYIKGGRYHFKGGVNPAAVVALLVGVVIVLLGMFIPSLKIVYDTGWFTGFFLSFVIYVGMMKRAKKSAPEATA